MYVFVEESVVDISLAELFRAKTSIENDVTESVKISSNDTIFTIFSFLALNYILRENHNIYYIFIQVIS